MDGQGQLITKKLVNDKPIVNEFECECGGKVYGASRSHYAKCTGGEYRCTVCRRTARKFGRGLSCGVNCVPYVS